ncbi:superoxide dismutase[Cu-Zn] [Mycobacterium montefiorense]|uniref:Superoxide dismutase [Cu-Zn] n=1 Tax=Mycobacterium montefiorense TaxID=154654 RepID=A0AA37PRN2_9MYCO|nr:superoxide dismutase family protein [Mycobacterium montefiorense]GBG40138.1 superoxide dismutase [Cu-Zn] [Mycobacterium montefiorense]GKU36707.1 superoxide dismutase [Cu-Zn] [Mycobacterium montefiorense]GKU38013.1 superoxide dismutase [Cu-Zn] [Mycobacterium montefiorense]GKU47325.1 superoxide dismutase [Cu-Zn] [Mycobacterium montefiorense]GKU50472.1 superoxide dismutase [Cu-Zn] [Mycobacterium montefiorense]
MSTNTTVAALLSIPVVAIAGCSSPQHASTQPGTTPPVHNEPLQSSATPNASPSGQALSAALKAPDGRQVATATFDFTDGYITVTVKTDTPGILAPGIHGMHVHQVGKCEPNSVAPTGGPAGNFLSAGGHYQAPGHTGKPESGDLASLEVRQDGSAYLVTTTDALTRDDLLGGTKTALMVHGPQDTDIAMDRVACGVIGPAS